MGLQAVKTENGASVLVIDQACDNDQLLVSLSKNASKWLSPIGWTDQQKVTLLDCRINGDTTEIDIPVEFAKDITSGDVLVLRCSELDLEKEIVWESSDIETRSVEETAPAVTGLAGGLLSRFKGTKSEPIEEMKSEAELRVEEADRAAQNFKAKMEAATVAKEDAQRKALVAAREAEAALKMEAERITEMECAAKAFEEAQRLKQDEVRRVEEERRAEEARLAEEARRTEEARLREIAAKKDAVRKAALKRFTDALDITREEEQRLKSRLKALKAQVKTEAANNAIQSDDLESRRGFLVTTEEAAHKNAARYNETALKLDAGVAQLTTIQNQSETLAAERENIAARITQADADYQQAQKEAEASIAKAETMRAKLEEARLAEGDLSSRVNTSEEKLSTQRLVTNDLNIKTDKLKAKSEAAKAELTQAKIEIEVIEKSFAAQSEKEQDLRLEVEATQQAIEGSQAREMSHRDAIDHLEAGGSPEDIADIDFEARDFTASAPQTELMSDDVLVRKPSGLMGLLRSKFAREKDAELSIAVEDVVLETPEVALETVDLDGMVDSSSFLRRHSSSLIALGAVIGGLAILGGGVALNQASTPTLEVKAKAPVPTQVASAVTKVELPKATDLGVIEEVKDVTELKFEIATAEIAPLTIELPKIDMAQTVGTEADRAAISETVEPEGQAVTEEAVLAAEVEVDPLVVKLAEVIDPTGFAFELPDMMPIESPQKADSQRSVKEAKAQKFEAKTKKTASLKTDVTTPKVKQTVAAKKVKPKATPKVEAVVNYPELTKDVQTRLTTLGFYAGEIDGLQSKATKEAITNFKTLFSMPDTNGKITGLLLTELKRAEREQDAAKLQAQVQEDAVQAALEAQASIQVVEVAPAITFYDTVQAVPSTSVVTDTLPAADAFTSVIEPLPAYVAPESQTVKVASIPSVVLEPVPTPAVQEVVVEAKVLKNAYVKYPSIAQRKNYFVNVAILVEYDIDTSGRASNIRIVSNDHSGKYNRSFEKEALRAIEKTQYEPKTINGIAVQTTGKQKRIVFRAG